MTIDDVLKLLPSGFRFHVGHTPHWYRRNEMPKYLRKRPFEAYVTKGDIGTPGYIFESADAETPELALSAAVAKATALACR